MPHARHLGLAALVALSALSLAALGLFPSASAEPPAPPPSPSAPPPPAEQLLGNLVVSASALRTLPKIGVVPSLSSDPNDVTVHTVVRRDLDLCGEFELLGDAQVPDGAYFDPVDVKAWQKKGAEAVVKLAGKKLEGGKVELEAKAYLVKLGDKPVFEKKVTVELASVRTEAHRLADVVIGALTGQNGGFASRLTFAFGSGKKRQVFRVDADGFDAKALSPEGRTALTPAFGKDGKLFYAGSEGGSEFRVYTEGVDAPLPLPVKGSVYGLAFSKDRAQVALSIGVGDSIKVFLGADLASIREVPGTPLALSPAFTPSGKLAFVGEGKYGTRLFVDGKAVTPDGLLVASPSFCNHPDGVRAILSVTVGRSSDLVSTGEKGGGLARLTQGQGSNSAPACSPDGRLVAFFSTRTSGEGPGLYVMRTDGYRPKRIASLLGDSLRWDPLPAPAPTK
jgi:TolB protein